MWLGSYYFAAVITLLVLIGTHELMRMAGFRIASFPILFVLMMGLLFFIHLLDIPIIQLSFITDINNILFLSLYILLACIVLSKNSFNFQHVAVLVLSVMYVGLGFYYFWLTREIYGFAMVLLILVLIWATDIGAYFAGKYLGRNKLWPTISPKKTIEGALGGICLTVVVAYIYHLINPQFSHVTELVIIAIVVSILGQMGDMVESAIKRFYHIKDSGRLLPGHGGVLDRFDSLLFVFPVLYFIQIL